MDQAAVEAEHNSWVYHRWTTVVDLAVETIVGVEAVMAAVAAGMTDLENAASDCSCSLGIGLLGT